MGQSLTLGESAFRQGFAGRIAGYFTMSRTAGAIHELDGLRGIAILLVMLRHGSRLFVATGQPGLRVRAGWLGGWDLMSPLVNGWAGVELFFVLSGFLITHHILRRRTAEPHGGGMRRYVAKRLLRIVPAYYAFLAIVVLGWIPGYAVAHHDLGLRVSYHLLFLQDYLPANIVVAFWSLGVEEKFYLLAPILVLALMRVGRPAHMVAMLAILFIAPLGLRIATFLSLPGPLSYDSSFFALRSPFHLSADALVVGTACGLVYDAHQRGSLRVSPEAAAGLFWAGLGVVALLLCSHRLLDSISWFDATVLFSMLSLGFGALLLGLVLHRGRRGAFFRRRSLFFFSKISYSLYLVHMVFLVSTYTMLNGWIGLDRYPAWLAMLLYLPVYGAISILGALALHYAVEKPFLMLKDRV